VVFAVGAKRRDPEAYREVYLDGLGRLLAGLDDEGQRPARVLFTSSTSVYGQSRGEWVDESSATHPRDFAGEMMMAAEGLLRSSPFPSVSLRLGGLYGPGRGRLLERIRGGGAVASDAAPHFTNRIHRDDAAGAIAHLMALPEPAQTYLGVDCDPADSGEVSRWLAERLGVAPSPSSEDDPASIGGRRCRNANLLASGYRFIYPTFREGYGALIDAGAENGSEA
jgi:nucleoside-diphosphate-sugar epimerase